MLGRESSQQSFLDASWSAESLLEGEGFYELLYREGPRLYPDEWFADCYDESTGRPSVPPGRMMKLLLLQTYEGLSDREARERMAFDLRWKAVLGMEVGEEPVAQATLVHFRARLQLHDKLEAAFERFLERAVEAGLLDPEEVQVVDSTAVWGRGAVEDTYNLIGSAVRKLLGVTADRRGVSAETVAEEVGLECTAPAEEGSLKGRAEIDWSEEEERRAFLNEVVGEARALLRETAGEQATDPEVREAAELLARLLRQDLEPADDEPPAGEEPEGPERSRGSGPSSPESREAEAGESRPEPDPPPELPDDPVLEAGRAVQIRRGVARNRVVSVHDPEMRHGHKSRKRRWDGYKTHVSVSAESEFVTAVEVTPANQKDAGVAPQLMDQQREAGLAPDVQVGDMAYSPMELRVAARKRGTEICARVPPATAAGDRFSKEDFDLDLEAERATCPAGEVTDRWYGRKGEGSGYFAFDGATCAACELREQCTGKDPEKMRETGYGRSVSVHARERLLQEARAKQETERFQQLIGLRPVVERKIGHLRRLGLRQARYLGAAKTEFQARATALVANLARMAALLPAEPKPRTGWAVAA